MAKSGMNPKTLQYLMGHSDIGVTLNTYTHLGLEDAQDELSRIAYITYNVKIFLYGCRKICQRKAVFTSKQICPTFSHCYFAYFYRIMPNYLC